MQPNNPKQIAALNGVFTPDAAEIERARRIIRAFEEADTGLVVIDGKLIEKPVLRDMHRIVAVAERVSGADLDALFDEWLYQEQLPEMPG